jgi:hypothetical protein
VIRSKIILHAPYSHGQEHEVDGLAFAFFGGSSAYCHLADLVRQQLLEVPIDQWLHNPFSCAFIPIPERRPVVPSRRVSQARPNGDWKKFPERLDKLQSPNRSKSARSIGTNASDNDSASTLEKESSLEFSGLRAILDGSGQRSESVADI